MEKRELGIREFLSNGDYCLATGVLFVAGALRGAIYDLNTARVFSVNETSCQILNDAADDEGNFWEKLVALSLATKENLPRKSVLPELLRKPELQFVWFEISSDDCNESCVHCYADSMPPTYRRMRENSDESYISLESVHDSADVKDKLTAQEWKQLITNSFSLGCKKGQFIGGEPFLYKGEQGENVLDLAAFAMDTGYEFIEIFTNGTLLSAEKVARIKRLGVNVAISLYSKDPEVHDRITNTSGSHKKTVAALHLLKESGVPTRVEIVAMRHNEQTIAETQAFLEETGFHPRSPDVLRPKGRGDHPRLTPSKETVVRYGLMTSPSFVADKETLSRYISGHSCLLGKITITDTGEILPCIFSRSLSVGNVHKNSLQDIIPLSLQFEAPELTFG